MSEPAQPRANVIVPVHGGWEHVERCLASLQSQTVPVDITVVDDASPDDTVTKLRERFPGIRLIENETNLGFARTCNRGIRAGDREIVILVNSDIVATANMVEALLAAFDAAPSSVASVSPILLAPDGTVDSFGITADSTIAGFVRYHGGSLASLRGERPRLLGPYGAVAAYRRSALDEVGLLDENIFMYGEELDLALRLRAAGWGAAELAEVVGTHVGGASAGTESERQRYLSGFGRGYLLRVYGVLKTRAGMRALLTEAIVSLARLALRGDSTSLRGRRDGWRRGKGEVRRSIPRSALERRITFRRSLAMRSAGYWRTGA
jgi:GT2 family glycosyltransferase